MTEIPVSTLKEDVGYTLCALALVLVGAAFFFGADGWWIPFWGAILALMGLAFFYFAVLIHKKNTHNYKNVKPQKK